MTARVQLFAIARERAGRPVIEVELPNPATVADLRASIGEAYPSLAPLLPSIRFSVDAEYAYDTTPIPAGAELAAIPPVSGGQEDGPMIEITEAPLDHAAITERVRSNRAGAVCSFLGTVREMTGDRQTSSLEYEAYPVMAHRKLAEIDAEARRRWPILESALVHRVGHLDLGEISVVVAVSCPHRDQAFEACRWLIDTLKEVVPIWKRENWADGTVEWVHPGGMPGGDRGQTEVQ